MDILGLMLAPYSWKLPCGSSTTTWQTCGQHARDIRVASTAGERQLKRQDITSVGQVFPMCSVLGLPVIVPLSR